MVGLNIGAVSCEHLHWWNVLKGGVCFVKEGGTCLLVVFAI